MESNSEMSPGRLVPSAGRLMTFALFLTGAAFTPACGGEQGGAEGAADAPVEARQGAQAGRSLKRGDRGPEVLKLYQYLRTYGYFPNPSLRVHAGWKPAIAEEVADPQVFDTVLERALVLFQRAHGLPQDGVLNEQTRRLMTMRRCGFPDYYRNVGAGEDLTADFTPAGTKWFTRSLSFSYANYTQDIPVASVESAVNWAISRWESVAGLKFYQVGSGGRLVLGFHVGDHGDGASNAFDGPGQVLAHAFYPPNGAIHFDDAETWSDNGAGFDLGVVALHEIGHALGLAHSSDTSAVMYAYMSGTRRDLAADDIQGMRYLYPNDVLVMNRGLGVGQSITSSNGRFTLLMQSDGNLVHYWNGYGPLWATNTGGSQGKSAWMQYDGNFVLYTTTSPVSGYSLWSSGTAGYSGSYLAVQDDGNLVVYYTYGNSLYPAWNSGTGGH